jgi:hypothetical protein
MTNSEILMMDAFRSQPLVKQDLIDEKILKETVDKILSTAFPIRAKFLIRSCLSVGHMIQEFFVIQASLTHKVHLRELITYELSDQPDNIKQLMIAVSRLSYLAIREGLFAAASTSPQR